MDGESIPERVNRILVQEFEIAPAALAPGKDLYEDLGLDSLDAIDLVVALERVFSFKVEEGTARRIRRLEQLYDFVAQHVTT